VHDHIQFPAQSASESLLRESVARLEAECKAVSWDRDAKALVIERLLAEGRFVEGDRQAKSGVIDRLVHEGTSLQTRVKEMEFELARRGQLEAVCKALSDDRDAKALVIERMLAEASRLEADRHAQSGLIDSLVRDSEALGVRLGEAEEKLGGKNEVIRIAADRELSRKANFWGLCDIAWRVPSLRALRPSYGSIIPAEGPSGGLHVAIDALEIVFGVSGGVETYMEMLVKTLLAGGYRVTILCLSDQLTLLQARFGARVSYLTMATSMAMRASTAAAKRLNPKQRLLPGTSLATFSRLREDFDIDLLHSPVQIFSILDFSAPAVLNLHDLQHLHLPQNFRDSDIEARNYLYGLSAALADSIVVSSEFVRRDLIERMKVLPSKVFTVPVTWNPLLEDAVQAFGAHEARQHYRLPDAFALYPAQFWPHKNHARLVEALAIARGRRAAADFKLVFTGYRGFPGWQDTAQAIARHDLGPHVLCLDHVPFEHLAGLYQASAFCVMPSMFEASSYPVIEAQVLGVPAMCSNVTSLPELMKDGAGLLFDPTDPADIADKMLRWIEDPADRRAHAARGMERARRENAPSAYLAGITAAYQHAVQNKQ
jgi:glycosyltransferase involved in cell wall biosynthesis